MEADERYDGMMAVTDYIDDEKPLYVQTDDDLNITAFRDERYDGAKYISGGIYALNEKAIDVLADCMERGVARMRNFQRALVDARKLYTDRSTATRNVSLVSALTM